MDLNIIKQNIVNGITKVYGNSEDAAILFACGALGTKIFKILSPSSANSVSGVALLILFYRPLQHLLQGSFAQQGPKRIILNITSVIASYALTKNLGFKISWGLATFAICIAEMTSRLIYLIRDVCRELKEELEEAYRTLGLSPKATNQEIKKAYRQLILKCHSDKVPKLQDESDEDYLKRLKESTNKFIKVHEAYKKLLPDG